jgi:protein TonB
MAMDYAQQQRDPSKHVLGLGIVLALHLVLGWALANGLGKRLVDVMKAPIVTRIIDEERPPPEPEKPLPPPPKSAPPQPSLMPPPDLRLAPPPDPPPTVAAAPRPAPPPPPPQQVLPTITPAEPVPPPRPAATANNAARSPEEVYLGELRAYLNSIKKYPSSREARQLRPQGTVKIWIELDRAGQLLGAGVEASAGTLLLDNEALRTVRNGRFPAFPAEAFAGQPSRRFVVPIEYQHVDG